MKARGGTFGFMLTAVALLTAMSACGPSAAAPELLPSPPAGAANTSLLKPSASTPPQPRVSIAGKIAFGRDGNVWVFEGGATHQLTAISGAADPAWSPDGSMLAFDKQDKNSADLYVMPYPGGTARSLSNNTNRVVENNLWEMQPDWSPDGLSLAYATDRGRINTGTLDPGVWRVTLTTGARSLLASPNQYTGGIDFPRWRPNHKSDILYTSWAYDPQTLQPYAQPMLENTQIGQRQALTPAGEISFQPAWSPDGNSVVFVKREQQREDLWIMSAPETVGPSSSATATPAMAKLLLQGRTAHPTWAPDGQAIAYLGLKDGSLDLFVQGLTAALEPDGAPKQLTNGLHLEGASAISWAR